MPTPERAFTKWIAANRWTIFTVFAACTVISAFWFIWLFSRHVYPVLPEQFGGGEPKQAYLLFSPAGAKEAQQLGIPFKAEQPQVSTPLTLLAENGAFYAVRLPTGPVVQVAQSSVLGLQVDSQHPRGVAIQAVNHGQAGIPEQGDELILTYSEKMDPAKIAPEWTGTKRDVWIDVSRTSKESTPELRIWADGDRQAELGLGTVEMGSGGYIKIFGDDTYKAHMTEDAQKIVISLIEAPIPIHRRAAPSRMTWEPSPAVTDLAGNACQTPRVDEQSGERQDREF